MPVAETPVLSGGPTIARRTRPQLRTHPTARNTPHGLVTAYDGDA